MTPSASPLGRGGSQGNRSTQEIAALIENRYHTPAMAHLTCVAAGREDVDRILDQLKAGGVEGIHLYTMNNPDVAKQIAGSISSIRKV